jgi:hypothetical protein
LRSISPIAAAAVVDETDVVTGHAQFFFYRALICTQW